MCFFNYYLNFYNNSYLHQIFLHLILYLEQIYSLVMKISIDYNFINYELECCGMEKMYNCFIDTLKLSRKLFKGQSCSLENLCAAFNIQTDRFHRALSDALATWQLFVFLCKKLDDMRINTLQELFIFSDLKRQ